MPETPVPPPPAPAPAPSGAGDPPAPPAAAGGSAAAAVALGILASRLLGLVREKAVAWYFGVGPHLDVFQLAMRGANLINNLLGEGTLSASFIPVYSRMLEQGREREAGRFAGAMLGLLVAIAAGTTLGGILLAKPLIALLAPGFLGDAAAVAAGAQAVDRYPLAVQAFRLALPMAAFLAMSAWALGVLNSHRRFFLPYMAPTLLNVAEVTAMIAVAGILLGDPFPEGGVPAHVLDTLLTAVMVGALVGGVLQFAVQLPVVFSVLRGFRLSFDWRVPGVSEAFKAFGPVVAGRGVAQLSSYVDTLLAGLAAAGTLGALRPAMVLYMLPISLFGMSVAASELPELSRLSAEARDAFLGRVNQSIRQVLYLVVPTVVGYLVFGRAIVAALFGGGAFDDDDVWLVTAILGGYSLGLGATAASRLLQNSFYAIGRTIVPARIAVLRVTVSGVVGAGLMFALDRHTVSEVVGLSAPSPLTLAAVGLALGASAGAWVELVALVVSLRGYLPTFRPPVGRAAQMTALALAAAVPGFALQWVVAPLLPPLLAGLVVVGVFGVGYLALGHAFGFGEGEVWTGRLLRRLRR